ncbi:hypothetical protein Saso_48170 [Streptomyces asoensis]|uniref:Uncharacterized protein n=1 Tax=Streptomyces asoensis TaxID=249586 RepID=A0ABQ3S5H3_9ACTN|nr:hypothetical protein GCM10010496_31520 [Streptomyces asoensis]GHI63167.1 hypothetical protein Saso_48170 [Streptomyces asoensis]
MGRNHWGTDMGELLCWWGVTAAGVDGRRPEPGEELVARVSAPRTAPGSPSVSRHRTRATVQGGTVDAEPDHRLRHIFDISNTARYFGLSG